MARLQADKALVITLFYGCLRAISILFFASQILGTCSYLSGSAASLPDAGEAQIVRQSGTKSLLDAEKPGIDKIVQLTAREHSTILFAVADREVQLPH